SRIPHSLTTTVQPGTHAKTHRRTPLAGIGLVRGDRRRPSPPRGWRPARLPMERETRSPVRKRGRRLRRYPTRFSRLRLRGGGRGARRGELGGRRVLVL